MCTVINPLIPESDQRLISPFIITLNQTLSYENKGNDIQLKNLLIVKQILPACTLGIVQRTVWRICILILGCKETSCDQFCKCKVLLEYVIAVSASAL